MKRDQGDIPRIMQQIQYLEKRLTFLTKEKKARSVLKISFPAQISKILTNFEGKFSKLREQIPKKKKKEKKNSRSKR